MITNEERRELVSDARSKRRRRGFSKIKGLVKTGKRSLDDYLDFLRNFQRVFSALAPNKKIAFPRNKP
ncbi:MAG: hypothetical protein ABH823_03765 [bacterium]